jgi:hypothetical protein
VAGGWQANLHAAAMSFYYTPFDKIDPDIAVLGEHAYASSGQCLAGRDEFSVVAHADSASSTIDNGLGTEMTADVLVGQMKRQGLDGRTRRIILHACNGGGSNFEWQLKQALHKYGLDRITVTGYAGMVGRIAGTGPVMIPEGYVARGGSNRDHRVIPHSTGSGRRAGH